MAKTDKQTIGKKGEDLTALFLEKHGFKILDRNYWKKWGEIDIVARKDQVVHFIEVKTVSRDQLPEDYSDVYEPEDNLHSWKLKRLARVIQTYVSERRLEEEIDWQVDAISVYLDRGGQLLKIDHLEDIDL